MIDPLENRTFPVRSSHRWVPCFSWSSCFANARCWHRTWLALDHDVCMTSAYTLSDGWCTFETVTYRRTFCSEHSPVALETEEMPISSRSLARLRRLFDRSRQRCDSRAPSNRCWARDTAEDFHDVYCCRHKYFLNNSPMHHKLQWKKNAKQWENMFRLEWLVEKSRHCCSYTCIALLFLFARKSEEMFNCFCCCFFS